jgi:hypothetical protein
MFLRRGSRRFRRAATNPPAACLVVALDPAVLLAALVFCCVASSNLNAATASFVSSKGESHRQAFVCNRQFAGVSLLIRGVEITLFLLRSLSLFYSSRYRQTSNLGPHINFGLFSRRACYHQNAFYRKLILCKIFRIATSVLFIFWYMIHRKKLWIFSESRFNVSMRSKVRSFYGTHVSSSQIIF